MAIMTPERDRSGFYRSRASFGVCYNSHMNKAKDETHCWKLWLRTRAQRVAAFAVLLMSVLGVFGGCHQSHLHREPPIIPTTTNRLTIASGNTTPVTASLT